MVKHFVDTGLEEMRHNFRSYDIINFCRAGVDDTRDVDKTGLSQTESFCMLS